MPTTAESAADGGAQVSPGGYPRPGRVVFSRERIAAGVERLAASIGSYYGDPSGSGEDELVALGVLKGSFLFLADLVRALDLPLRVDFVEASSYGASTRSSGEVRMGREPDVDLAGRRVLLVEDVVDSGATLRRILRWLEEREPADVQVCALLDKKLPESRDVRARWTGFAAPDEFLVGYGLDYSESFRHLPYIATLEVAPVPSVPE